MTVLAGHPGPEGGGVAYVERLPQRRDSDARESGGAMDLCRLLAAAEATEGACVVCALGADDRRGAGAVATAGGTSQRMER